jgi:hypothetical protein
MSDDAFWADANRQRHIAFVTPRFFGDAEVRRERAAQAIFFPALATFQARVRDAAALSALMQEDFAYVLDALDDHAPTQIHWDEKLEGARR